MNKKEQARVDSLLPLKNNVRVPRWIRVYDNGGETADRYTIVFTGRYCKLVGEEYLYVTSSSNPINPQGVYLHGSSKNPIDTPRYGHLGKRITFLDLPSDVQSCVRFDYLGIWGVKL